MSDLDKAAETQLENIQAKTGQSLDQLRDLIARSGLSKHSDIRQMLMDQLGLGYGDANALVHFARRADDQGPAGGQDRSVDDALDGLYAGSKTALRPVHDSLMAAIQPFGPFEIVPKKSYVSLRRKRQFAMIGPASKGRVEVGLNMKEVEATPRLLSQRPGGMCQYKVYLTTGSEVDVELIAWIKFAFDNAG